MHEEEPFKPYFRVVKSGNKRHGFRLEGVFWKALHAVTKTDGMSLADYVARLSDVKTGEAGLSSHLRASVMKRALEQIELLRERMGKFSSRSIVAACPAPGIIISVDKRILYQNSAFLMYLQSGFGGLDHDKAMGQITLALEIPFAELIEEMQRENGRPKYTGFTLGYGERRLRGRLSLTLAPDMVDPAAAIAFVYGPS